VYFAAEVIGLDPSEKMLAQARAKPHAGRVRYVRARAEAMPVRSGSIDAIFMSMSLHHFSDHPGAAAECRRILGDHGRLVIRTGTREQIPAYPYYPFFPTSHQILEEVLPDRRGIREVYERAGFGLLAEDLLTQTIAPDWATYADKLATRADSVMARLEPAAFARGLAAVREHARWTGGQPVVEPIDLLVFG
jgi:SAM-dependent methyltransferase